MRYAKTTKQHQIIVESGFQRTALAAISRPQQRSLASRIPHTALGLIVEIAASRFQLEINKSISLAFADKPRASRLGEQSRDAELGKER
jgi:hypothetical protein